jgi:hypothetical protein
MSTFLMAEETILSVDKRALSPLFMACLVSSLIRLRIMGKPGFGAVLT